MSTEKIAFEQNDIEQVTELQTKYSMTTAQIGQIEVELHLQKRRLNELEKTRGLLFATYTELQLAEEQLVKTLNEKYGDGVLDLDSGTFNPSTT